MIRGRVGGGEQENQGSSEDGQPATRATHLMSSYSPSGGMKLMLRSESNLLSRTHWWKVQSSMAMDCFPLLLQEERATWKGGGGETKDRI